MASNPNIYRYIEGESTNSIFYFSEGGNWFCVSMLEEDDNNAFCPETCTKFSSSTMGLLLSEPYNVFNPLSAMSPDRVIPSPPRQHPDHLPRALVVYKNGNGGHHVFHVICALPSTNPLYPPNVAHAFDVYSSNTNQWHLSSEHILGRIRADTNVSCGTRAYWITETPLVVCYDVADGSVDILAVPLKFWDSRMQYQFQLGQRDVDLCFVALTEVEVEVYTLGSNRQWSSSLRFKFPNRLSAIPTRFQSKKFELLFWLVDDRLAELETAWESEESVSSTDSYLRFTYIVPPFPERPSSVADILPLIRTDLDPEEDFPTGP